MQVRNMGHGKLFEGISPLYLLSSEYHCYDSILHNSIKLFVSSAQDCALIISCLGLMMTKGIKEN